MECRFRCPHQLRQILSFDWIEPDGLAPLIIAFQEAYINRISFLVASLLSNIINQNLGSSCGRAVTSTTRDLGFNPASAIFTYYDDLLHIQI